jgi:hypothetical protein
LRELLVCYAMEEYECVQFLLQENQPFQLVGTGDLAEFSEVRKVAQLFLENLEPVALFIELWGCVSWIEDGQVPTVD